MYGMPVHVCLRAQVSTLCAVCKVLFNLCAEGADSSGLRDQELGPLLAVLTSLRASSAWMERKDVSQVGNPTAQPSMSYHQELQHAQYRSAAEYPDCLAALVVTTCVAALHARAGHGSAAQATRAGRRRPELGPGFVFSCNSLGLCPY